MNDQHSVQTAAKQTPAHANPRYAPGGLSPLFDEQTTYTRLHKSFRPTDKLRGYFYWLTLQSDLKSPAENAAEAAFFKRVQEWTLQLSSDLATDGAIAKDFTCQGDLRIEVRDGEDDRLVAELSALGINGRKCRLFVFDPRASLKLCDLLGLDFARVGPEEFMHRLLGGDLLGKDADPARENIDRFAVAQMLSAVPDLDAKVTNNCVQWTAAIPGGSRALPPGLLLAAVTEDSQIFVFRRAAKHWVRVTPTIVRPDVMELVRKWWKVAALVAASVALTLALQPNDQPPVLPLASGPQLSFIAGPPSRGVKPRVVHEGDNYTIDCRWETAAPQQAWLFQIDRKAVRRVATGTYEQGALHLAYDDTFDETTGTEFFVVVSGREDSPEPGDHWLDPEALKQLQSLPADGRDDEARAIVRRALGQSLQSAGKFEIRVLSVDHR